MKNVLGIGGWGGTWNLTIKHAPQRTRHMCAAGVERLSALFSTHMFLYSHSKVKLAFRRLYICFSRQ